MPLDSNLSLQTLFGEGADLQVTEQGKLTLTLDSADLGVSDASKLSPEGLVLAILAKLLKTQGTSSSRILDISKDLPIIAVRGGEPIRGEKFNVKVFTAVPFEPISPTDV